MNRRVMVVLVLLVIATGVMAGAETIYLKSGDKITGTIIETKEESIVVDTDQGKLEILKENIERIDYTEGSGESESRNRNAAFIWRPLPTLVAAMSGTFDLVFEGQTAFTKEFAITAIGELGSMQSIFVTSLQLGPQYRPGGDYLKGFILGLYPGIGCLTDFTAWIWFYSLTLELGYQWVSKSGFVLGLTTGGSVIGGNPYLNTWKWNLSAHFGFAFPDPFFKAK